MATGPVEHASADPPGEALACNDQAPQPFLVRGNYLSREGTSPEERRARRELHQRAIRYRTEKYGHVAGFGAPEWNASPPISYAEETTFMGMRLLVNRRILPALRCAEQEIKATCGAPSYRPQYLSGFRASNTYYNGEVSNHLYGITIDVDPEHNICCRCLGASREHPICKRTTTLRERMAMPACWVSAFERYGFYWLGRDELEDTMHFEFLGDPDRIVRPAAQRGAPAAP